MARSHTVFAGIVAGWLSFGAAAFSQPSQETPAQPAQPQVSLKLARVVVNIPAGEAWLSLGVGSLTCNPQPDVRGWPGGRSDENLSSYTAPFKTEFERAGYKVVTPGEDNLFESRSGSADYDVAAVITTASVEGCINPGGLLNGTAGIRGDGSMKIDWQIYSRLKKEVVAKISTSGTSKVPKSVPGGVTLLISQAFGSNARELTSNAEFQAALSGPKTVASQSAERPGSLTTINLAGNMKAPTRSIADAVGSVVTLLTGSGSGSGVLVSDDGYLLTNEHVVDDAKEVRVRWSDGIETTGQVVRSAKNRDIALVKTNARDRIPLAIKRGAVSPGQRVYAIGTPLDKTFQGTVSSGVVSANRTIDGLRYIQSDTTISPGSSGGALIDESGSVIGIAVSGYQNNGQMLGLNMFIPIGDAMDFLSLERK